MTSPPIKKVLDNLEKMIIRIYASDYTLPIIILTIFIIDYFSSIITIIF